MSPTVFREGPYRFYFFSREERRMHVHVEHADGEAKVWLDPALEIAESVGTSARQLRVILRIVQEHKHEIEAAWRAHFGS
jgi:hypothetical protein